MTRRALIPFLIAAALSAAAVAQDPDDLFPGERETFELAPGASMVFTYVAEGGGEAHVWASSPLLDVTLEVTKKDAPKPLKDDDSGGGRAAYMRFDVAAEDEVRVVVTAKPRDDETRPARVTVTVNEVPERASAAAERTALVKIIAEMKALREAGRLPDARAAGRRAFELVSKLPSPPWDAALTSEVSEAAAQAWHAQDLAAAHALMEKVVAGREATLPATHPNLQACRGGYALSKRFLGDLDGAKAIQEKVIAVFEMCVPDDHPDLQVARENYALTLIDLRDLEAAGAIQEKVLAVREKTLPEDDPVRMKSLDAYASILFSRGDLEGARARYERVLTSREKTLPEFDIDLQRSRSNYATLLFTMGDVDAATPIFAKMVRALAKTLPEDHPDLLVGRLNYASALYSAGDLAGALALQQEILAQREKSLPADHPDLQKARNNCATTLASLGEVAAARALQEKVLEARERTLPPDDVMIQRARLNYASTAFALGDHDGAKALFEKALAAFERKLPTEHPDLQAARGDYAIVLKTIGDLAAARKLEEKVLEVFERTHPEDHIDRLRCRANLANTLHDLGDVARAKELLEGVLGIYDRTFPADHPEPQAVRLNLANALHALGDIGAAKVLHAQVLAVRERILPYDHLDLQASRVNIANVLHAVAQTDEAAAGELERHLLSLLEATRGIVGRFTESLSPRQVAAMVATRQKVLDTVLSFASEEDRDPRIDSGAFLFAEELRGAAVRARRLLETSSASDAARQARIGTLRSTLVQRRRAFDTFLSSPGPGAESLESTSGRLERLAREKEAAERTLLDALRENPEAGAALQSVELGDVMKALPPDAIGVSYLRYRRSRIAGVVDGRNDWRHADHLTAFVLLPGEAPTRIDLGPIDVVARSIDRWRALVAADSPSETHAVGAELRRRLLDPILAITGERTRRVFVALSDDLHAMPLDALPLNEGELVGDRLSVLFLQGLEELTRAHDRPLAPPRLVAFGDVDFGSEAAPLDEETGDAVAARTRGGDKSGQPNWTRSFSDLAQTRREVSALSGIFARAFAGSARAPLVFTGPRADKERFRAFAPRARFLHLATHGFFAPESVPSLLDAQPGDRAIGLRRTGFREQVMGYEPLSLCGLALTGANLPPRKDGTHRGLLTGHEIAALDLSGVELAVLSACDTNVGVRRAGQGIMSLREALFSAGVRHSITSLWKVPDEATMILMTRFYEGIWSRGETKHQALWAAKEVLREAKDPRTGKPKYGLRDWAGWVLYGNPED